MPVCRMEGNLPEEDNAMTKTLNPTITVTVSGPTGSGKSRVLAVIADVLKLIHGDCIIEAPDVEAEIKNRGNNHLNWHKARSGTIFKLEEINQSINTGRCITTPITIEDLFDRPTPVHIQKLMDKLGVFIEGPEYQEADLQPVVDLVNWALTTPPVPEQATQPDKKENEYSSRNPDCLSGVTNKDRKNAPQVTLLAQEDIIQRAVESVI
ncbi:ATP-binding cassette domain-containing protein, partial [Salmonella enterica subsp. enterica serovar Poano]|nr:ATP-binding cassette domain-containing protein [Salmonella enterica subsp. enterica serovar Poano]